jgi:hypothetical protein
MPDKRLTHNLLAAAGPGTSTARDVDPPSMHIDRQAAEGHTPHTLPLQGLVNRVIRGLLRTPLLCRAVGHWLLTVYVTGRKSGRRYAVPVAYTPNGDSLLVGTSLLGWSPWKIQKWWSVYRPCRRMSTDQALASSRRELSAAPGAIAAPATRFAMFAGSGGMPMPRSAG